jgi:hypothetical protein
VRPNNGLGLEIAEAAKRQGESAIRCGGRETRVLLLLGFGFVVCFEGVE